METKDITKLNCNQLVIKVIFYDDEMSLTWLEEIKSPTGKFSHIIITQNFWNNTWDESCSRTNNPEKVLKLLSTTDYYKSELDEVGPIKSIEITTKQQVNLDFHLLEELDNA